MIMSGYGTCPGCREITKLTEHHDKDLKIKVMICDSCHKVIVIFNIAIKLNYKLEKYFINTTSRIFFLR